MLKISKYVELYTIKSNYDTIAVLVGTFHIFGILLMLDVDSKMYLKSEYVKSCFNQSAWGKITALTNTCRLHHVFGHHLILSWYLIPNLDFRAPIPFVFFLWLRADGRQTDVRTGGRRAAGGWRRAGRRPSPPTLSCYVYEIQPPSTLSKTLQNKSEQYMSHKIM